MTDEKIVARAMLAMEPWGGCAERPQMIRNRENIVLKGMLKTGDKVAIRLHRRGYQSASSIMAELRWTEALAQAGFACPTPIRQGTGELIQRLPDGQLCSVINWIDATPIGEAGNALPGSPEDQTALYHEIGTLCAQLHQVSDDLNLEPLDRLKWSSDGFLGDDPNWGRFWENPTLSAEETELLMDARQRAARHLEAMTEADQGLIHADLMQENLLKADRLWLIDFDDCGYGYRIYDLATALIQHEQSAHFPKLQEAILAGYAAQSARPEISPQDITLFIMLRGMASCGWIMSRATPSDPRQRFYAERALRCVRRYAQTSTS